MALTSLVLLLVLDQARLQPWVYQYILVLGVLLAYTFQKKEKRSEVYPVLSMIIVFMYLYSGLSKINPTFFNEVSIWMIEPITQQVSVWAQGPFLMVSKGIPFLEIGVAVGLIFKSTRKYAGVILIMIHIFILILIGPLGHDWNSVVWPWNIFSILFILLLFIYNKGLDFRKIISASESLLFKFFFFSCAYFLSSVFLIFGIPIFLLTCIQAMFITGSCSLRKKQKEDYQVIIKMKSQ